VGLGGFNISRSHLQNVMSGMKCTKCEHSPRDKTES
jgi:hypothetical protein